MTNDGITMLVVIGLAMTAAAILFLRVFLFHSDKDGFIGQWFLRLRCILVSTVIVSVIGIPILMKSRTDFIRAERYESSHMSLVRNQDPDERAYKPEDRPSFLGSVLLPVLFAGVLFGFAFAAFMRNVVPVREDAVDE